MTQEQLTQLARIYNTLMQVNTKGEDTFIMSDCLRAMQQLLVDMQEQNQSAGFEPIIEEE